MKASGVYVMSFLVIGTALASLVLCIQQGTPFTFLGNDNGMARTMSSRKLKDINVVEDLEMEDYRPVDPVPSSEASIRPGPVQHGSPLMPYIPNPAPPPGQF